jgi:hypothetical protein
MPVTRPVQSPAMRIVLALLVVGALSGNAFGRGYQDLGVREKEAVNEALALRGLAVDPQPDGKIIGAVQVVNLDVFTDRDLFFAWFNRFHWTTKEEMIRREALFHPGEIYKQTLVDETARNLESPVYTSALGIVAVQSNKPGFVDVLIVTRDLWSLRLNTDFQYQAGHLLAATASLAENNLFGHRKYLALVTDLDLGKVDAGPSYLDPNIAGTRLTTTVDLRLLFSRQSQDLEGSYAHLAFGYPLFALDTPWGFGIDYSYSNQVVRVFQGNSLRQLPFTADDGTTQVFRPYSYRLRTFGGTAAVTRRYHAHGVVQEVSLGHQLSFVRPSLLADFPDDPGVSQMFENTIFPRLVGTISSLYASYHIFTPRYRIYRDLNTFDLRETVTLGPSATVLAQRADELFGSAYQYWFLSAAAGWNFSLADGLQTVGLGWSVRLHDGTWSDEALSANVFIATPVIAHALRVVGSVVTNLVFDNEQNTLVTVGGDSGLRGYAVGEFLGQNGMIGHLEVRSMALSVLSLRAGALIFYDVGDAPPVSSVAAALPSDQDNIFHRTFDALRSFHAYQDVGLGLRVLIPQFNTYVLRLDWAFALNDDNLPSPVQTRAGWPGRFSAGFMQAF